MKLPSLYTVVGVMVSAAKFCQRPNYLLQLAEKSCIELATLSPLPPAVLVATEPAWLNHLPTNTHTLTYIMCEPHSEVSNARQCCRYVRR
jgi:hypothetical protein